ncbi:unnamed protein product [Miscanthus lutarioriparius]|uniref:BTB domain-containing protein n=1 Tax=Miscanthus lutarioriparius TaxID=422564 RepID=A0A811MI47_9POAL|nr:unnamed protein product [Miscanthus lutarioriparius]
MSFCGVSFNSLETAVCRHLPLRPHPSLSAGTTCSWSMATHAQSRTPPTASAYGQTTSSSEAIAGSSSTTLMAMNRRIPTTYPFYLVLDEHNIVEPVVAHARESFERSKHLRNDSFTIRCDVSITKNVNIGEAGAAVRFVNVPPPDIQHHLGSLLLSQEGTDVTFQVGDEKFIAHRCLFAARSAVFKAELFGAMKEGTTDTVVHIDDMDAKSEEEEEEYMWQDLLVAADRYDVPRLRLICERMLCPYINTDTVATMLELADKHHCNGLKDACLDFLNSPANLQEVTAAGGLNDLTISCPAVLIELIAKLTSSLKLDNKMIIRT